ncbi:MAG: FAD-dependent oxidoreductase [bacterium]|nr:FAD-dependent oxidoreductase [bacterium]
MSTPSKIPARVDQIIPHGHGTYSLLLLPERRVPRYLPGQFLHLALDPYDPSQHWPESRVFSIASPYGSLPLRILFSVVGRYTRRMEQELRPGATVWLKLPYGEFCIKTDAEAVLVAGGTGISAFTAFLGALPHQPPPHPVTLLYGARTPELLVYRPLLQQWQRATPNFRVLYFAESGDLPNDVLPGRLSCQAAFTAAHNPHSARFYFSGPPAMLANFTRHMHDDFHIDHTRLIIDAWE